MTNLLQEQLDELCAGFNGRVGYVAQQLQTGALVAGFAEELFPTASTIKLPVLLTLMQQVEEGKASLEEPLMLRRADKLSGSGLLQYLSPGLTMCVRDWAFLMMSISDNTATNVLIDFVGLAAVQAWLAAHDYADVQLHHKLDFAGVAQDLHHFGSATPAGLNRMMTAVWRRELVSAAACDEMLRLMDKVGSERVGRYLPFEPFGCDVPDEDKLRLAGKTGSFLGSRSQTAVVWRGVGETARGFSLTVMTEGDLAPERWSVDAEGVLLIGRIAQAVYGAWMGDGDR